MNSVADRAGRVIMDTYGDRPRTFVRGEGVRLFDADGRSYIDGLGGLAVIAVGHANPAVTRAAGEQLATLAHTSNLFHTEPQVQLAERLVELSGLDRVFFANCGATANEASIKLARRYGQAQGGHGRFRIVSLHDSFHGRTLATLAATGQPSKQATFAPLPEGFQQVPGGDIDALEAALDGSVAAVMLETVQGEGGVVPWPDSYLVEVRRLCDATGTLLIVDDVQAGMGRTGEWFSWQGTPIQPDIASVAKALANGLPIGASLATAEVAAAFRPGDHATTFGGGPVVCAAALAVIDEIAGKGLLANARARGVQLAGALSQLEGVVGVRGKGLLLAVRLDSDMAAAVVAACLDNGLILNAVRPDAVRWAPPLTISEKETEQALQIFARSLAEVRGADGG